MTKVLVIDDDKDIATTTSMMLEKSGYEVAMELDEKQAMATIEKFKPDCLVLDVMFPGNAEGGFELSRSIRAKYPTLPIIMVTSVNETASVKFSNKDKDQSWLPIDEFVNKPIKKDVLISLVKRLTGNGG